MSRLEVASERFKSALDSVEARALALTEAREQAKKAIAQSSLLATEREHLMARVAELEEESRSLAGLTEEVEGRLDGAIAEIRAALGR
ncbi:MAG TPA: DUF4164 family protein [Rhizomicrobium sp.]|jgi:hypothetical protein|nr:DUF4164 family protein [Rhizomicrobium sp.]